MKPLNNSDLAKVIFTNLKIIVGASEISFKEIQDNPKLKDQLVIQALNMMVTNQSIRGIHEKDIDDRVKNPQRRYEKEGKTFYVVDGGVK